MRTERAIKIRLCQLNNNLLHRHGEEKEICLSEIKLLEWVLKMDKRSLKLERLAKKKLTSKDK